MNGKNKTWPDYNPQEMEARLQKIWERDCIYHVIEDQELQKYYCLDFFPYPSGEGLHVGHCRNYFPTDVLSRYKRMQGYNVLHPMGWDAFGEPTEHYAITHGIHPRQSTDLNSANFKRQMKMIGTSYDWTREIDSSRPEFYHWTQYFFLLFYQRGLAYRDNQWQWWCPTCETTLSSHEVVDGVCWRGHSGVTKKKIPAWYFRITAYADELLSSLDEIDWPERIKLMQRNWIGRSEGCEIIFKTESGTPIPIFTTRPDTIFGSTFFVLAPEHDLVDQITTDAYRDEVREYISQAKLQSEADRLSEKRAISGVFTGSYVINPLSSERMSIWISDYVLPTYGTGAIMGVPAHDGRDFQFAKHYGLPVKVVVEPPDYNEQPLTEAYTGSGRLINSSDFSGLPDSIASEKICSELSARKLGGHAVNYRMHDWVISRQRYWGTPIPIIYCEACGQVPVPLDNLPVLLPEMDDFSLDSTGESPLARISDFVNVKCPICGGMARRETDTMGGFACSSWYFLRFVSPGYQEGPFEPEAMRYWMPVDLYMGGAEHAVLHLLYARFWTMALADIGLLPFREPFSKLVNQGQLLAPDGQRMSKSRGNVITPDEITATYGADSLRVYELFMAPFDQDIRWNIEGIVGAYRFLERIWLMYRESYFDSEGSEEVDDELERWLHQTIQKVSQRIEDFRFNTVVSALMEFVNVLMDRYRTGHWHSSTYHQSLDILLVLLAPITPFIADEIWLLTGHSGSIHNQSWPAWDPELVWEPDLQLPVQVNGRLRAVINAPANASQESVEEIAFSDPGIIRNIEGKQIRKIYYVQGKILNIIAK